MLKTKDINILYNTYSPDQNINLSSLNYNEQRDRSNSITSDF